MTPLTWTSTLLVLCAFQIVQTRQVLTRDKNGVSFVRITSQASLISLESIFLEQVVTMWEGLLFFCAIDTSSSDYFGDCFYLLAKSEGSKPWSSFGTPTRNKSTCHLHSPFLEVQLRGNWIRTIIQSDLEKLVPNQIDQSTNSESTALEKHILKLSVPCHLQGLLARRKASFQAVGYVSSWAVWNALFQMNSWSGTVVSELFSPEPPSPQTQHFQWCLWLQAAPWEMEIASLEPSYAET